MAGGLPRTKEELGPEFFSEVLGAPVADITIEPLGQSFFGEAVRCRLTYKGDGDGDRPGSVTVKLPSPDPDVAAILWAEGAYKGEVRFYNELAEDAPLRVPRVWLAHYDFDDRVFIEVMEDLSPLRHISDIDGCPVDDAVRVLDAMADFHAHFWNGRGIPVWVEPEMANTGFTDNVIEGAGRAADRLVGVVRGSLVEWTRGYGEIYPALVERLDRDPVTLTHGDIRVENVFFDADEIVVIDWETVRRRRAVVDVAYLIGMSVREEERAGRIGELLDHYLDRLAANGVNAGHVAVMRGSFPDALAAGWAIAVQVVAHTDLTAEGAMEVVTAAANRYAAALEEAKII